MLTHLLTRKTPLLQGHSRLLEHIPTSPDLRILHHHLDPPLLHLPPAHLHPDPHHVPAHHGPDALRRPRQHDIALLQRHHLADVAQQPRDPKQHQRRGVALPVLAVDAQPQRDVVGVGNLGHGDGRRDGAEGVEALGDGPGQALALCLVLDVARRQVDGREVVRDDGVEAEEGGGGGGGQVVVGPAAAAAVGPDDEAELDFVVQRRPGGADHGAGAGGVEGGGRFEEEEGLRGAGGGEFGNVVARRGKNGGVSGGMFGAGGVVQWRGWVGGWALYA